MKTPKEARIRLISSRSLQSLALGVEVMKKESIDMIDKGRRDLRIPLIQSRSRRVRQKKSSKKSMKVKKYTLELRNLNELVSLMLSQKK